MGHLILESDPEHGEELGTPVSKERVIEAFEKDVEIVVLLLQLPTLNGRG